MIRVTYLASASVIVEAGDVRILCDPWLEDGEYYGSWAHVPPLAVDYDALDYDWIYISHIHPDHMSAKTLVKLKKRPVLIHAYAGKALKKAIEGLGFEVRELAHGARTDLGHGATITILAADGCDPELCGSFFRCAPIHGQTGSTQLDTISVIEHGGEVLVNTNDCPFPLVQPIADRIAADHGGRVDILLTGYTGAGPYPQCFSNLTVKEKLLKANAKKKQFLEQGMAFIRTMRPRIVMPFAGQYTLAGRLEPLNDLRGVVSLGEAFVYYSTHTQSDVRVAAPMRGGFFSCEHIPQLMWLDPIKRSMAAYRDVLAQRSFDFDDDPMPSQADLEHLCLAAHQRLIAKLPLYDLIRTDVVVPLAPDCCAVLRLAEGAISFRKTPPETDYVRMTVEPRLLYRLLKGTAHWSHASIGSHIRYDRKPDVFDIRVHDLMSHFRA